MLKLSWQHLPLYMEIMRANRPIGTFLVLWPAMWALMFAAESWPAPKLVIIFALGAFLMRSAGCVINDYADRDWDHAVARTKDRPITDGRLESTEALQLFMLLCILAASLLLFLDRKTQLWSLGAISLAIIYPFTKRITQLPQVFLGVAFAWSIPMAYVAEKGSVESTTWLLFTAVIAWVVMYDTFYAMVDKKDDLHVGIKSTAILFGEYDRSITTLLQLLFLAIMAYAGTIKEYSVSFFIGLAMAAVLFGYQQWLIRKRHPDDCFRAFLNNNYVGIVVSLGICLSSVI